MVDGKMSSVCKGLDGVRGHHFYPLFIFTLFIFGSLLFLGGFFLTSQHVPEANKYEGELDKEELSPISAIHPVKPVIFHSQFIIMIIDALRSDFVRMENMPFTYNNACQHVHLKVDTPTVTMPRLKSMLTGTISDFIDIVYNLGTGSETLHDSILHRLRNFQKSVVFAGDHTWERLFPSKVFKRAQFNIDSLFVNDFDEGDKNVTNFLNNEMLLYDWNVMILHYLGLDHIGHVEGDASPKIASKLREMDKIISSIVAKANFNNKMLIVTSDHGMRKGGGHGGSEPEELFVPLLMFESNCPSKTDKKRQPIIHYETTTAYKQIDLAPTLAAIMGIDTPSESLGALIPEMISHYPYEGQLYYYFRNSQHLIHKLLDRIHLNKIRQHNYFKWFEMALSSHGKYLENKFRYKSASMAIYEDAKQNYIRISKELSNMLSMKSGSFRYDMIVIGLILTVLCILNSLVDLFYEIHNPFVVGFIQSVQSRVLFWILVAFFSTVLCYYIEYVEINNIGDMIASTVGMGAIFILATNLIVHVIRVLMEHHWTFVKKRRVQRIPWIFVAAFLCRTATMGSSSFIEEEHLVWYYLTATLYLFLVGKHLFGEWYSRRVRFFKIRLTEVVGSYRSSDIIIKTEHEESIGLPQSHWRFCDNLLPLLIILVAQHCNGSGLRWYNRQTIDQFIQYANKSFLQVIFILGLLLLFWQLNCFPKQRLSLWLSFVTGLALFNTLFYRELIWKIENYKEYQRNNTKRYDSVAINYLDGYKYLSKCTLIAFWTCIVVMALNQCGRLMEMICCVSQESLKRTKSPSRPSKSTTNPVNYPLAYTLYTKLTCLILIFALLQRPHSVVLLPCLLYTLECGYHICDSLHFPHRIILKCQTHQRWFMKTVLTVFVGEMFYYCQGNSNQLSTINLNPGYIGLSSYNPVIVGTLITLHQYTAPITALWYLMWHLSYSVEHAKHRGDVALLKDIDEGDPNEIVGLVVKAYMLMIMVPVAFYWFLLLGFRYHLFIYSVFAPKAVFTCIHLLVVYINVVIVNLYIIFHRRKTAK